MGQTYLISGGSGDIGLAVYHKLETLGHSPIAAYSSHKPDLEHTIHMDLTKTDSINNAISYLVENHADLSGVVLAASPAPTLSLFARITPEDMQTQLNVNVIGVQILLAGLVKIFKKNKSGAVVGVLTDAMGDSQSPAMSQMGAYVIAKYGLLGVLKLLEADYKWLSVDTVSPGFVETKMLDSFDVRFLDMMRAQKPFQTADQIADDIVEKALNKKRA